MDKSDIKSKEKVSIKDIYEVNPRLTINRLREKLEEMILNYCFGSWGEKIMDFMEFLGCIEDWRIRDEIKKDEEEYYGLSPEQIAICKEAKKINKIKYEEALKIRWEELAKYAKRPTDEYHNNLCPHE